MPFQIMVVDDEVPMLQSLERILRDRGKFIVRTVSNSLEVPELLANEEYDIVITDLRMPGLTGIDIARLVMERGRGEAVIIITAFGSLDTAIKAFEAGVSEYITKPFTREQINTALARAIDTRERYLAACQFEQITLIEPFEVAVELFKEKYILNLAKQENYQPNMIAKRAGIDAKTVELVLGKIS